MTNPPGHRAPVFWLAVAGIGLGAAVLSLLMGVRVALYGYLTAYTFWLGAPLGCAGLVMTHRLTGGRWGWAVLGPARAAMTTVPVLALLFVPVAVGLWHIYPWAAAGAIDPADPHLWFRRAYLTPWFFIARAALFLAIWVAGGWWLLRGRSRAGEPPWTPTSEVAAAIGLILLVFTVSFAGIDWIGSLTARWYSSMFGFYLLTSFGLTGVAVLIVATGLRGGDGDVGRDVLRDLGNLLLTFIILHAYMAFSQFLIIWNGNEPNEIAFYPHRGRGLWAGIAALVAVIQFFLPLLALLMRSVKRRHRALMMVACLVLISQALEAAWLVLPSLSLPGRSDAAAAMLGALPAIASLVGMGGLWMVWFEWAWARQAPILAASRAAVEGGHHE